MKVIPPSSAVGRSQYSYIELMEDEQGCMQIAYFVSPTTTNPTTWLTSTGDSSGTSPACAWEVLSISGVDADRGIVYFMSSEEGSTQRHLYSVHLDGKAKLKLTPPPGINWGGSIRTFNTTRSRLKGSAGPSSPGEMGIDDIVGEVAYYEATFSQKCGYSFISYLGPDVPFSTVIALDDSSKDYDFITTVL
jgi:hypothetical protein